MKVDPEELLGISRVIDSIKSAFPRVVEAEKDAIQRPLNQVQKFCDSKYKDLTGTDPSVIKCAQLKLPFRLEDLC